VHFKWALPFLACIALTVAGCSHYSLGTGKALEFHTLFIEPIGNATMLPQAVATVSTELREAFLRDGRVVVVNTAAEADAILALNLSRYSRDVATVLANDTGLARKFDLTLTATATLRDRRSDKIWFRDRPLTVKRQIFTDNPQAKGEFGNQLQAEYTTLPLLAESLSKSAVHAVLDVW